jgi:hypothetical protein
MSGRDTTRKIEWLGRKWIITRADGLMAQTPNLNDIDIGLCNHTFGRISFRHIDRDSDILTLLHEMLHAIYPDLDESSVRRGEVDLKLGLEALGVNLNPMLKGFK